MQYLLKNVDLSKVHAGERKIVFGISSVDLGYVQPIFLAEDDSLGGHRHPKRASFLIEKYK